MRTERRIYQMHSMRTRRLRLRGIRCCGCHLWMCIGGGPLAFGWATPFGCASFVFRASDGHVTLDHMLHAGQRTCFGRPRSGLFPCTSMDRWPGGLHVKVGHPSRAQSLVKYILLKPAHT